MARVFVGVAVEDLSWMFLVFLDLGSSNVISIFSLFPWCKRLCQTWDVLMEIAIRPFRLACWGFVEFVSRA